MEGNLYPAWMDHVIHLNALKGDDDEFLAYISAKDLEERGYVYAPASISGYAVELNCALSPFSQPTVDSGSTCGLESLHFWEPAVSADSVAYRNLLALEDRDPSPTEEDAPVIATDEALGDAEPCGRPAQGVEGPSDLLRDAEEIQTLHGLTQEIKHPAIQDVKAVDEVLTCHTDTPNALLPEIKDQTSLSTMDQTPCCRSQEVNTPSDFTQGLNTAGLDLSNAEITSAKPQKERKNSGCFSWLFRIFRRKKNSKSRVYPM